MTIVAVLDSGTAIFFVEFKGVLEQMTILTVMTVLFYFYIELLVYRYIVV